VKTIEKLGTGQGGNLALKGSGKKELHRMALDFGSPA
jgi:hypothetical protein